MFMRERSKDSLATFSTTLVWHLDGGWVMCGVGCLDNGAQHFDALLWVDGTGQLMRSPRQPHHLKHGPSVSELHTTTHFERATGSAALSAGNPRHHPYPWLHFHAKS